MNILSRRRHRPVRHIVLYGKPGCHLCEDARHLLDRLNRRYPLEIEEVDIRSDSVLFRAYDIRIPVIVIDAGEELEAPIQEEKLVAALAGS